MALTNTAIRNANPGNKTKKTFDGDGLYLEVSPSRGKWWRLKFRYGGKENRLSLGVYPESSLKGAPRGETRPVNYWLMVSTLRTTAMRRRLRKRSGPQIASR